MISLWGYFYIRFNFKESQDKNLKKIRKAYEIEGTIISHDYRSLGHSNGISLENLNNWEIIKQEKQNITKKETIFIV